MDPAQPEDRLAPLRIDGQIDAGPLGSVWWVTDVGKVRSRNEDRLFVRQAWGGAYLALVVADGAGGHDSGDKAAEAVIATLDRWFPPVGEIPDGEPGTWLAQMVAEAHAAVRELGSGQPRPPASTIVGLLVERDSLCGWRFHVGDSRLYVREAANPPAPWTRDHNIINGLIDRGLPEAQAQRIADGGRLTQVVGGMTVPEPDIWGPIQLGPGTTVLICSDGIYGHNRGRDVLGPAMDLSRGGTERRAQELKVAVLDGDAPDNLTAVLWDVAPTATPTRQRDAVAQQVRGPDAAAIRDRAAQQERGGTHDDDEEPSSPLPVALLLATFAIAGGILWWATREDSSPPSPPPLPLQSTAAAPAPADLPWSSDLETRQVQEGIVRKLGDSWSSFPEASQRSAMALLSGLLVARSLDGVELKWEEGAARAQAGITYEDWPQAHAANVARAAESWAARESLARDHASLAQMGPVADWMRYSGCIQVKTRWPKTSDLVPADLASWLGACLPPGSTTPVTVKLGDWPDRGWSKADLAEIDALRKPGGDLALQEGRALTPRLKELSALALALGDPALAEVRATVRVVLPPLDPPGNLPPEQLRKRAQGLADDLSSLLRSASGGRARVVPLGEVDDEPVASATDEGGLTVDQAIRLADLNRRVEITLNREAPLEPDDTPASP